MERAAVFEDAQSPDGRLLGNAVIEHDHAIRDVLLDAVTCQRSVAAFARDHCSDAAFFQKLKEPSQFGTKNGRVRERTEHRFDRVDHHSLRTDSIDGSAEAQEQTLEVPFAGFLQVAVHQGDVVQHQIAVGLELGQVEAERCDIRSQVVDALLERHEHARLVELGDPPYQELHRNQRLATAGRPAHKRRATLRQTSTGHLIETADTGRSLQQTRQLRRGGAHPHQRSVFNVAYGC